MNKFTQSVALALFVMLIVQTHAGSALAQACQVSVDPLAFGSLTRTKVSSAVTRATVRASCTGEPGQTIRLCPQVSTAAIASAKNPASQVGLALFSDPNTQLPFKGGIDIALGPNGMGQASAPIYARLSLAGQAVATGAYQGNVDLGLIGSYISTGAVCRGSGPSTPAIARSGGSRIAVRR